MIRLLVFCEAKGDFTVASSLADRSLAERGPSWVRDNLEYLRSWVGAGAGEPFVVWRGLRALRDRLGVRPPLGHYRGEPAKLDEMSARTALAVARHLAKQEPIEAVVLVRDDDGLPERRLGYERAREQAGDLQPGFQVVIGIAAHEIEAWILAGFDPESLEEARRIEAAKTDLGFDPVAESHRLAAKHDHDKGSVKRVLAVLTDGEPERQAACFERTSLDVLDARGGPNGLSAFLAEVRARLAPLFEGRRPT